MKKGVKWFLRPGFEDEGNSWILGELGKAFEDAAEYCAFILRFRIFTEK